MGQVVSSRDPTERRYIYNHVTRGRFCDKANPPIQSRTLEATEFHSSTNGVYTNLKPRIGFGKDQMNRPEVVKLLRNIFAYDDVQIAVYTHEENGIHAKTAESDAEFYADDEIEKGSEKIFLETDFIKSCKSSQPTCDERVPIFLHLQTDYSNQLIDHFIQNQPKDFTNYVKDSDFQYSDLTNEEVVLLIDKLVDARDVFSDITNLIWVKFNKWSTSN